ncbi:hypothetical protein GDO78_002328 [Eleutherodactylus coqui]|uniref:Uncharacterized protein n=1 Tax=Eleutherodactylus coqui TaxID=57060 RepID=A0A8J6EWU3_ELECQ|nr:hypothetical protein GDO78_002328 [Eleutherodactylus coqui]
MIRTSPLSSGSIPVTQDRINAWVFCTDFVFGASLYFVAFSMQFQVFQTSGPPLRTSSTLWRVFFTVLRFPSVYLLAHFLSVQVLLRPYSIGVLQAFACMVLGSVVDLISGYFFCLNFSENIYSI